MRQKWFHSRWESRLWSGGTLGHVARIIYSGWNAYTSVVGFDYISTFPTRAAAMRAVVSATDPKKGYFL